MSVPFSNTHLRVPRGFGTILEGLAREILRDQPEDIPKYAAQYFDVLLKQREDSGMDPAEWAARLEDRFYNNHAFKDAEASPEKEPDAEGIISKDKPNVSQTEEVSGPSAEASAEATTHLNISEEADLTESAGEEVKEQDITEKYTISMEKELSEGQAINTLPAADVPSDELSGTEEEEEWEEERDPTITTFDHADRAANEKDGSPVPDQNILQSELEPTDLLSVRGTSNLDVCAQELGTMDDEGGDKEETAVVGEEIVDQEGEEKTEEPAEASPYSGVADMDVCATELVGTQTTTEEVTDEDDTHLSESSQLQAEKTFVQSALSQSETPEDNEQEAEDKADETKEVAGAETQTSSGGIHESLTRTEGGLDSNVIPKQESLVEVSFEDVPEAQQIKEADVKQPEEEDSVDVSQTVTEMQQEEESKEVTAVATEHNILSTQDDTEPAMVRAETEHKSEGEEMESQHETSAIMKEKVDANDSNLNGCEDDEKGEGVKTISSSHQPTGEADQENPAHETDHKNEGRKMNESEFHQNESDDPVSKDDETTDTVEGDEEGVHAESYNEVGDREICDGVVENNSLQVTHPNISTAAMEEETLESLQEENEESHGAPVESQPGVETEVTSKERTSEAGGFAKEGKIDSEIQERGDAMCEDGSISPTKSADRPTADDQGEEGALESEEDTTELKGNSGDKQEDCSRPQEEEDIMDIPLDDPEANRAAAKIQAGFRGHMTRKKMKPEDKAEGEEVSSTGDVLNGSQGDTETGGSGAVEGEDTSVPEQ